MSSVEISTAAADRLQERTLYALWVLFWILMTVVELQDNWYATGLKWWEPFLWMGSAAGLATLWFVLQRRLDHRIHFDAAHPQQWFLAQLKWLPAVAATLIVGMYGIRHAVYAVLGMRYEHAPWLFVAIYESIKLGLFFGLWLGIFFAFNSFRALQEERQRLLLVQKSLSEARLTQLKAQLRPHFFFNVLNTISALIHVDANRADQLLARLGDFLRTTLRADGQVWPLAEELRLLRLYSDIMLARFADRVTLSWNVQRDLDDAPVPVLLLQPLIENAFRHGVEPTSDHVSVEVNVQAEHDRLQLEVRNDGTLATGPEGVGLRNVRERLEVLFGKQAELRVTQSGQSVVAQVRMPLRPAL